jgi:flagellar protein FliL
MATAASAARASGVGVAEAGPAAPRSRKKLLLLAVPVLLAAIGAGLWFGGVPPPLLGLGKHATAEAQAQAPAEQPAAPVKPPSYVELPDVVANLNAGRHASFIKLKARVELEKAEDIPAIQAAMPRLLDLFQTYLREMRPEELRGSIGTWRLREELIARANVAVAPAHVVDVLFTEMLIQ